MRALRAMVAIAALTALTAGCGDDDETTSTTTIPEPAPAEPEDGAAPPDGDEDRPEGAGRDAETSAAIRVVREYVRALDDRDGERVCEVLAPGAIDEVTLPVVGATCGASVGASIGYRDPRGLPVWQNARVGEVISAEVDGDTAKVVATTITLFADRTEPSIEDDVVYLVRRDGRWLLAKPSSTLYRAVGIADIPPSVLAPP